MSVQAPARLGLAWSPGSHKSVVRGGFGIYFEHPTLYQWQSLIGEMVPVNVAGSYLDNAQIGFAANPLVGVRFPDGPTTQVDKLAATPNQRTVEYNMQPVYVYRWSLNLEREMGSWFFSAGYSGARGLHNWVAGDGNVYRWVGWPNNVPSDQKHWTDAATPGYTPVSINPSFANIWVQSSNNNNYYHGLVVNAVRRLKAGLQLQAAYTFGKSIDYGSAAQNSEGGLPQNERTTYYWDEAMRRGLSSFDIRQNFVSNITYQVPETGMKGIGGMAVNGWQVNGVLTWSAGHAFTVTDSTRAQTTAMRITTGLRPNLITNGKNHPILGRTDAWYDVNQFIPSVCRAGVMCIEQDPATGRVTNRADQGYQAGYFGNAGRNTLTGPGLATFDFSLNKNFPVTETTRVQFRAEFFNLFNRANFRIPITTPFNTNGTRNPLAGQITDTRTAPREIQFGLKYIF